MAVPSPAPAQNHRRKRPKPKASGKLAGGPGSQARSGKEENNAIGVLSEKI